MDDVNQQLIEIAERLIDDPDTPYYQLELSWDGLKRKPVAKLAHKQLGGRSIYGHGDTWHEAKMDLLVRLRGAT